MPSKFQTVEADARARAGQKLADGAAIMDKGLLIRCADEIARLRKALGEIADQGQTRGGIWARNHADDTLEK